MYLCSVPSQSLRLAGEKYMSKKVGRPTKYYPEIYGDIEAYLLTTGRENTKLPTIEGLALYLNVHKDTLYEWAKENREFSDALDKLKMLQKEQLINDGIYGGKEVNSAIVKLVLGHNHGMTDAPTTLIQNNNYKEIIKQINDE